MRFATIRGAIWIPRSWWSKTTIRTSTSCVSCSSGTATKWSPHAPVAGDRAKALAAGCAGHIEKPIVPEGFVAQIAGFLSRSGTVAPRAGDMA